MSDENSKVETAETKLPEGRVMVTIKTGFMYNGTFVNEGEVVEMNVDRAVNHMRVGDVERDEELIAKVKEARTAKAKAAQADAEGDW